VKPKSLAVFLSHQSLFKDLSMEETERVAARMELRDLADDEVIFAEGEPCDGWYVVVRGEVAIVKGGSGGMDHDLAQLEEGEGFGEMGLIDDAPRLATATAVGKTTVARLPREAFHQLLRDDGSVGARIVMAMARVLVQRQRALTAILTDLVDDPETAAPGPREMISMLLLR
jgi:CRP/FNR family transcriptional regulator